jgi:hypothetical protein
MHHKVFLSMLQPLLASCPLLVDGLVGGVWLVGFGWWVLVDPKEKVHPKET